MKQEFDCVDYARSWFPMGLSTLDSDLKKVVRKNVAGYQAIVLFDDSALDYVKSANGNYHPADTSFGDPTRGRWLF